MRESVCASACLFNNMVISFIRGNGEAKKGGEELNNKQKLAFQPTLTLQTTRIVLARSLSFPGFEKMFVLLLSHSKAHKRHRLLCSVVGYTFLGVCAKASILYNKMIAQVTTRISWTSFWSFLALTIFCLWTPF